VICLPFFDTFIYRASGQVRGCDPTLLGKHRTKSHYFSKIALLWTIWPESVILHFLAKIALFWNKNCTFFQFFPNFSRCLELPMFRWLLLIMHVLSHSVYLCSCLRQYHHWIGIFGRFSKSLITSKHNFWGRGETKKNWTNFHYWFPISNRNGKYSTIFLCDKHFMVEGQASIIFCGMPKPSWSHQFQCPPMAFGLPQNLQSWTKVLGTLPEKCAVLER